MQCGSSIGAREESLSRLFRAMHPCMGCFLLSEDAQSSLGCTGTLVPCWPAPFLQVYSCRLFIFGFCDLLCFSSDLLFTVALIYYH